MSTRNFCRWVVEYSDSDIMDSITQYGIENHESLTALLKEWGDEHLN
jgi:hypothetical protein